MKRNSGLIGARREATIGTAVGIYDTFDAYNARRNNSWPLSFRYISLSPGSGTINENTSTAFTFTTAGFESNTTLYWTILNGTSTSSDFYASGVSGSFTQNASTNTGVFTVITSFTGNTSKTTKTFQIQIRTGSTGGTVVFTSGTFSIPAVTASVSWSVTPVNEGSSTNLQVTLGNIGSYTIYGASISNSGTAGALDFSSLPTSMNIGSGTWTITYTTLADFTTEGSETLTATVSYGGFTLGNPTLTISDTSQTPTASLSPSANPISEGSTMTFTVTTTNFSSGTLYWTLENVSNWESSDQSATSGSFTITSSAGSFNFTITADGYTEGTEQFLARVRVNSTSGTIIGTSATISISDTSTGTTEPQWNQTQFQGMCNYLRNYMSEYKNPSFYSYTLDGSTNYIGDGGGDMYDNGNYTNPWFISGTDYSQITGDPGASLSYSTTTATTTDTDFVYCSLGYSTSPDYRPLTMLGYRSTANRVVGFQKSGNSGADGGGVLSSALLYNGSTINTFTVYAFHRETYSASDPSHCDLYMLIGHTNWGSSFGTVTSYAHPVGSGGNGGRLHTSTGSTNVVAVTMLLSKSGGVEVTAAECQTVVQSFTARMKLYFGY